jgi:glycosyltransferase involved in cell wall biosynthesis
LKSNNNLVSIIIPVYNRTDELRRCLSAVINQSCPDFEAIIVDDCSTIDIKSIVDEFNDQRLKCLRNSKNGGPQNARTTGWKNAKGGIIMNIDSDWEPFPWMLERVQYYFSRYEDVDAVTGMHIDQNESRMYVRVKEKTRVVSYSDSLPQKGGGDCVTAARNYVIKEYLKRSDGYYASEYHLNLTFLQKFRSLFVDEPWSRLYIDSGNRVSDTFGKNIHRWVNDCKLFLNDYREDFISNPSFEPLRNQLLNNSIFLIRNKQLELAGEYIKVLKYAYKHPEFIIFRKIASRFFEKIKYKLSGEKDSKTIWI